MDRRVRKLFDLYRLMKRGWVQGTFSRKANGRNCTAKDPEAVEWCLYYGCKAVSDSIEEKWELVDIMGFKGYLDIVMWSDRKDIKKEDVLGRIALAIDTIRVKW